jgi:hypothetical protein
MFRLAVLLLLIVCGPPAHAGATQQLKPDTKFPSVLDLSNGKPAQWVEPEGESGAPIYYGGTATSQGGGSLEAPRTQAVRGYTRKSGTYVAPYLRSSRRR